MSDTDKNTIPIQTYRVPVSDFRLTYTPDLEEPAGEAAEALLTLCMGGNSTIFQCTVYLDSSGRPIPQSLALALRHLAGVMECNHGQ